jgi:hypothetical protein
MDHGARYDFVDGTGALDLGDSRTTTSTRVRDEIGRPRYARGGIVALAAPEARSWRFALSTRRRSRHDLRIARASGTAVNNGADGREPEPRLLTESDLLEDLIGDDDDDETGKTVCGRCGQRRQHPPRSTPPPRMAP